MSTESGYKSVTVYETRDGKQHSSERAAAEWAQWIDDLAAANAMFENGATLLDALMRAHQGQAWYRVTDEYAVLNHVTKDTRLVISYWQCHDQPAYRPMYLTDKGEVFCGGNGGWSGYYGRGVPVREVVRHAQDTFKRFPVVF